MDAVRNRRARFPVVGRPSLFRALRWGALLGCVVLAALAAAGPELARACVQVQRFVAGPAPDAVIPGNLVFFRVFEGPSVGVEFTLVDTDTGAAIPSAIVTMADDRVLRPDAAIEPGRHLALLETHSIAGTSSGAKDVVRHPFTTGEHAQVVLRRPRLEVIEDSGNEVVLRLTSPDASGSAKHLLSVSATLDGQALSADSAEPYTFVVRSSCDGTSTWNSCTGLTSVSEGEHELEVRTHILGSMVQPEVVRRRVETACGGCSADPRGASATGSLLPMLLGLLLWRGRAQRR
jgi:hypothetical protein